MWPLFIILVYVPKTSMYINMKLEVSVTEKKRGRRHGTPSSQ